MSTISYRDQLLSPQWQRRRLEIMNRDNFACQCCGDADSTLHVHHKQYVKGRMAWEYPDAELVTLCHHCHASAHGQSDDMKELVAQLPLDGPGCIGNAMALVAGWANGAQGIDLTRFAEMGRYHYAVGEVASLLSLALSLQELKALYEALSTSGNQEIRDGVAQLRAALSGQGRAES